MNDNINNTAANGTFKKTLWASHKSIFEKKIKHLNKILLRNGKSPITFTYSEPRSVPVTFTYHQKGEAFRNDTTVTRSVEVVDAICSGLLTVQKGDTPFVYLGTVSFIGGIKQVFCNNEKYAPFFMDSFRDHYRDHCHTRRTNRKAYHLFLNPSTYQVLQIGSTCAKEYFGINSDRFLTTYHETFITIYDGSEEDLLDFSRGCSTFSFAEVAPFVSLVTNGFLKWHKASEASQWDDVLPITEQPSTAAVADCLRSLGTLHPVSPSDADRSNVKLLTLDETLAFCQAKYDSESSTFAYNCLQTLKAGYTTYRSLGAFCYAIFAAYNNKVRSIQDAQIAAATHIVPCAYPVNSRQTLTGTITNIRTFQTESCYDSYNVLNVTKYIVDFTDSNGTFYHFITSGTSFSSLRPNDQISLRATIGETKPFKNIPYTHLSRPTATLIRRPSDAQQKQSA